MSIKLSDEDKMTLLNLITTNILANMDNMDISRSDNKIHDYIEYLYTKTSISKSRLKRILTLDVVKLITIEDLFKISLALNIETRDLVDGLYKDDTIK